MTPRKDTEMMQVCKALFPEVMSKEREYHDRNRPPLVPLPPLSKEHYDMVDDALEAIYLEHCPSRSESDHRQSALDNLQNYLNQHFDPTIELQLFGSSKNGFGFGGSDMDICLMFTGYREEPPAQYNSAADVITALSNVLKNNKMMTNVTPVINARVPIVKFEYFYNNKVYEGDISYYNMLAQRNTELLMTYANIDERCQKLGYVLKGNHPG